ncbi:MAG: hypothetical protein ABIK31_01690 [candidate division WOR-3 bacterium]
MLNLKYCIFSNEKGQALFESLFVLLVLMGFISIIMYFGKLGDKLEKAHMGARVLTFDAGTPEFAWPFEPDKASSETEPPDLSFAGPFFQLPFVSRITQKFIGTRKGAITVNQTGKVGVWDIIPYNIEIEISYYADESPWRDWEGTAQNIFRGSIIPFSPGVYNMSVVGNINLSRIRELLQQINDAVTRILDYIRRLFGGH